MQQHVAELKLPVSPPEKLQLLEKTVPEKFRCILKGKSPYRTSHAHPLAVEADESSLCLASLHEKRKIAEIHAFAGNPRCFPRLLQKTEELLAEKGIEVASFLFIEEEEQAPLLKGLLQKKGWSPPRLFQIRLYFDSYAFNPPWFQKPPPLSEEFEIFPWDVLQEKEQERIKRLEGQERLSPILSPFREKEAIQPVNSLGIRYKGELVGWMVTHTFTDKPDSIRYSSLYIDEELRGKGAAPALLAEAIRRQKKSAVRWSSCEINCELSGKGWIRFVERRLKPHTVSVEHVLKSGKALFCP